MAVDWKPIFGADYYQVFVNDNLFSEQQFSSFLYTLTASEDSVRIKVVPKNKLGCSFYQAENTCLLPTSTNTISEKKPEPKIAIFPNPNRGRFKIETDFIIEKAEVFNLSGNRISGDLELKNSTEADFKISHPTNGIYFLKIYSKDQIFVKKIIVH